MTKATAMRLETFSYLPRLSDEQIARQIDCILRKALVPAIEYTTEPGPRSVYWSMWGLPLFDVDTVEKVMAEIAACAQAHPDAFVKLIGYEPRRQRQAASFVVRRPDPDGVGRGSADGGATPRR